jgi:hypothetical protein
MGRRRTQRTDDTFRQLLLSDHRKRFGPASRWPLPGRVSEYERALVAGEPIVIDSGTIMCALMHAGLPSDEYAFGGPQWGKQWYLDVDGTLSEWTGPEDKSNDRLSAAQSQSSRSGV